jgi:hypothetical protein
MYHIMFRPGSQVPLCRGNTIMLRKYHPYHMDSALPVAQLCFAFSLPHLETIPKLFPSFWKRFTIYS